MTSQLTESYLRAKLSHFAKSITIKSMRKPFAKIRGAGFILWQTRHEFYHVITGLLFAWYLREVWRQFNVTWVIFTVLGSLVPDLDHFIYFLTYGKKDWYTKQVRSFLHDHEWRTLWWFVANGHKHNTNLATHNYYFMAGLFFIALVSFVIDWKIGVILFGSMLIHYLFDVADDIVTLGRINPNWKRWGRPKKAEN